jgi:hypothetical protein
MIARICSTGGEVIKMISLFPTSFEDHTFLEGWNFYRDIHNRIGYLQKRYRFPQDHTPEVVRDKQTSLDNLPIENVRW